MTGRVTVMTVETMKVTFEVEVVPLLHTSEVRNVMTIQFSRKAYPAKNCKKALLLEMKCSSCG